MGAACCTDITVQRNQAVAGESAAPTTAPLTSPGTDGVSSSVKAPVATAQAALDPAPYPAENAEDEKFISTVGELPTFSKGPASNEENSDAESIGGVSEIYDGMSLKEQQKQAKKVVKEFVKEMVKGKKIRVMKQNGQLTTCTVSLTRALDALKIKAGGQTREIGLKEIVEICCGTEVQDIETPLDDLCATLMLASEDCITFRLEDMNARDTFIMCLGMFCNNQQQ
mmetsp:Transcript_96429/g.152513  ORF Transcript_96429/g.152513 Transcript_96429/m.152513 type:complete len:226 (-) Transcript_96429:120-797(-)